MSVWTMEPNGGNRGIHFVVSKSSQVWYSCVEDIRGPSILLHHMFYVVILKVIPIMENSALTSEFLRPSVSPLNCESTPSVEDSIDDVNAANSFPGKGKKNAVLLNLINHFSANVSLRFIYEGERIDTLKMPAMYGMADGDIIDVMIEFSKDKGMPTYLPMGGGIIDTSVGREIGMPHIIYHIPHGRRFGDVMNGPLKKISYRHTDSTSYTSRLELGGLGMVIIEACEVNRTSEEHSEKARAHYTQDDVDVDYWLPHQRSTGGVIDTDIGRDIIDRTFLVYYIWQASRFGHMQNVSLKAIGVQAEGDLLMMKLDGCSDCEVGHLLDVIDAITHLMRNRIVMVVAMEDSVVSRSLNTIVQSYYQGSHDAIAHLIYEQNTSLCEEYAGTSVYVDQKENTVLRGSLLGRLHFGMCLMGEIVDLPSRSWIYKCNTQKESLMVYVDPKVVVLRIHQQWKLYWTECADFPVHLHMTLKKHTSVVCPCEIFVVHVEEMEIIPY
ncbi:hypothetical protein F5146DRAFT_1004426 [Armillaria mellea]|nr:hypothetical protein F5146DRAFT_1004426 [Armillaria mellea]